MDDWISVVGFMQRKLNKYAQVQPKIKPDGLYGNETSRALGQAFPGDAHAPNRVTGNMMAKIDWTHAQAGTP